MTPEGWQLLTAEVALNATSRIGWKGLSKSDFTNEGPHLITGMHFRDDGRIDWPACFRIPQWRYDESPEVMVRPDDILLTKDGTIGKVAHVRELPGPAALNSHLYLLRPAATGPYPRFLFYVLQSDGFRHFVGVNASGSTIVGLPWKVFRNFEIPVPPPSEQRKIAAILSSVDDAIEATQTVIDQLQVVKKAMMAELLTRGLPGRHTRFKLTEIGEVPEEWEVVRAEDACDAVIDCKNRTPPYTPDGFPVVRTPNVRDGHLLTKGIRFTDAGSYREWTARGIPTAGDVLITREAPVGETCLVPHGIELCLGQRMMLMRPNRARLLSDFLVLAIQGEGIQKHLDFVSGGSTVGHVRVGDIRRVPIPMPPLKEQRAISEALGSIHSRLVPEWNALAALISLKSALMSVLLTGEVRVTPDEAAA